MTWGLPLYRGTSLRWRFPNFYETCPTDVRVSFQSSSLQRAIASFQNITESRVKSLVRLLRKYPIGRRVTCVLFVRHKKANEGLHPHPSVQSTSLPTGTRFVAIGQGEHEGRQRPIETIRAIVEGEWKIVCLVKNGQYIALSCKHSTSYSSVLSFYRSFHSYLE